MNNAASHYDVVLGCHAELGGFGGSAIQAQELAGACLAVGWKPLLRGFGDHATRLANLPGDIPREDVDTSPRRGLWRVHTWCISRLLANHLRRLPRPRLAFVSFSPFWTVAAKRAWPDLPVVARYCGILSNCTRLARPPQQRLGLWARVGDAGARAAEDQAFRLADRILVPTREHAEEISEFMRGANVRVVECHEGCPVPVIDEVVRGRTRREFGFADGDFVSLAIGSFDRNKAFDYAIDEMAGVDPRGRLMIVGDGPERDALKQLARERRVERRVHILGRQPDVAIWYAAADCILSTSRYDTFPNTIKEALCCDRLAIVPRHDPPHVYAGVSGLVERERLGFTYDRRQSGALAACVNEMITKRDTLGVQAIEAGAKARRMFTWDATLEQIRDVAQVEDETPLPRAADDDSAELLDADTAGNVACPSEPVCPGSIPTTTHGCRHE